ncbi:MAG: type II secretion system minor pseudopilin GspI [Betaproteobacteria bacterium]|nr:type II secretion system minor pseudopilin GspI [Betaproteobacteria bacterium]
MTRRRGFTLIEVMVALTVLAVAFAAGYRALGQSTNNAELLKRRALAQWVAQNQLAQMQISRTTVTAGAGAARQAGLDFIWRTTLTATPNASFRKAEIVVADPAQPDYQLARLSAYLSAPQ